jgi:RNA polymerase sigma-70 factor (ECF subfamily)
MLSNPIWSTAYAPAGVFADDAALVAALKRGEADAVTYVVQQYVPSLYRYVYYQVQDAMLAEDLVSDVLMKMLGNVGTYVQGGTPFQAWLFRIARNRIVDHYRARRRRPQVSLEAWLTDDPGAEPGASDAGLAALPERDALQTGLAELTAEQRQVILLHVVDGWELPEVARMLDRSVPSVKSLYYRGVQSLRRVMTREPKALRPAA